MDILSTLRNTAVAALIVIGSAQAFSPDSKSNVAIYYGQSPSPTPLKVYCEDPSIDVVILSFVHKFPAQGAGGMPATNFWSDCPSDKFPGTELLSSCNQISQGIQTCQTNGKKVLLALGGDAGSPYQISSADEGLDFADKLWGLFGPRSTSWVNSGKPRPFDLDGRVIEVDGFDFDIEKTSPELHELVALDKRAKSYDQISNWHPCTEYKLENQAGYIALANRLRELFATSGKNYYLSAASQCVIPDANVGELIDKVPMDMIFVQFYNTPYCSARAFIEKGESSGFSYNDWSATISNSASRNAKLYIGLPADPTTGTAAHYLHGKEVAKVVAAHASDPHFGGIMLWEAGRSYKNNEHGKPYHQMAKDVLNRLTSSPASKPKPVPSTSSKKTKIANTPTKVRTSVSLDLTPLYSD